MDIEQMKKDLGGGNVFPIGEENVAFAKYFTGECYLNMLTTERVPVGLVTFAPGTINAYHIHHKGGQILLVTGGRGWYQEEGKPARELKAGDVVNISPEVKHWHGAAKDSWFQHLAVEVPVIFSGMADPFCWSYGSNSSQNQKLSAVYADAGFYRTGLSVVVSGFHIVYSHADAGASACIG